MERDDGGDSNIKQQQEQQRQLQRREPQASAEPLACCLALDWRLQLLYLADEEGLLFLEGLVLCRTKNTMRCDAISAMGTRDGNSCIVSA